MLWVCGQWPLCFLITQMQMKVAYTTYFRVCHLDAADGEWWMQVFKSKQWWSWTTCNKLQKVKHKKIKMWQYIMDKFLNCILHWFIFSKISKLITATSPFYIIHDLLTVFLRKACLHMLKVHMCTIARYMLSNLKWGRGWVGVVCFDSILLMAACADR